MSSQVFPTLIGQGWSVTRTPMWSTQVQTSVSGKETRAAFWSYPRYEWELVFNMLRTGTIRQTAYTELQQLLGLYQACNGSFDSFLYTDGDDNAVTGQAIGTGDGVTTTFQLVRAFASYVEPIFAPNTVSAVRVNGVLKTLGTDYTVGAWGSANPGLITFTVAPPDTQAITADFSYYFPCSPVATTSVNPTSAVRSLSSVAAKPPGTATRVPSASGTLTASP